MPGFQQNYLHQVKHLRAETSHVLDSTKKIKIDAADTPDVEVRTYV